MSRGSPAALQRQRNGRPLATSSVTGVARSLFPAPRSPISQSANPATSARYASSLAPPRNAQRHSPLAVTVAERRPSRSRNSTTGRAAPCRPRLAVSPATAPESGVSGSTPLSGGSESHASPASAAASGDAAAGAAYQSPGAPGAAGHANTLPAGRIARRRSASPTSATRRAPAIARVTVVAASGASEPLSRQPPLRSGCTNTFTGTRATSPSVRARKRDSQSGGAARITAPGSGLTSTTKTRASSRGSASLTPASVTSSADHPLGNRAAGSDRSNATVPLSGNAIGRAMSTRPPSRTSILAPPFPFPLSPFPALPAVTRSAIVSFTPTRRVPSTPAMYASGKTGRGSTTTFGSRDKSAGRSATSGSSPSVTTTTGPPRAAAAASAGASRLAPSAGGAVSNAATRAPKRQITPPRANARAVSSAALQRPPWPARESEASSSTSGRAASAGARTPGFQRSRSSAATPVARRASKPTPSRRMPAPQTA